jgi:hypothetical protein
VTRAAGRAPGISRRPRGLGSGGKGGGCIPRQAALELVQARTMAGTPEPIRADCVDPLGPHLRQQAADTLLGQEGPSLPPMGPGVRLATADLALVAGAHTGGSHGDAMDVSAQVVEHSCRAWPRRCARDDPGGGPDRRGQVQLGALLVHQGTEPTAAPVRAGPDGPEVRLASRLPRLVVSRDPTGRHETVPVWMVSEGPGPGVPHPEDAEQAADVVRVRGTRDA